MTSGSLLIRAPDNPGCVAYGNATIFNISKCAHVHPTKLLQVLLVDCHCWSAHTSAAAQLTSGR